MNRENSENESEESKSKNVYKQFLRSCRCGKVEDVQSALQNVNATLKVIGLFDAIEYGKLGIVELLLENGVSINARDTNYREDTVLHHAATTNQVCVGLLKMLIQKGADVNAVTKCGKTALHLAAALGYVDVTKVLIQNGADVNAIDRNGYSPLTNAVDEYHVRCALHLLCSGAEIGASEYDLTLDRTGQLGKINSCLISLRNGRGVKPLMSDEERRFMWNLAFSFTIQYRGAAFKAYYAIRSFITFHGIFMASGYIFGPGSFWRRAEIETKEIEDLEIREYYNDLMVEHQGN